MPTTAAAIRDAMLALLEAVTPSVQAGTRFRAHREQQDFRAWAEANPVGCVRRVSIRYAGKFAPPSVTGTDYEETSDTFEVVIAYQANARFGANVMTSLDDVIASDERQVHASIGPYGYHSTTAQATVIQQDGWERENGKGVVFAVIRYRVDFWRSTGFEPSAVTIAGLNGALAEGDILTTDAEKRALVIQNGIWKVTYENLSSQTGSAHAYCRNSTTESWLATSDTGYGDYSYFVTTLTTCDEIEVITATDEVVEVAFRWLAWAVGIYDRDHTGSTNYDSNNTPKTIATTRLTKLIRVERGLQGYFLGYHTDPLIGPTPAQNEADAGGRTDYGEREFGTGTGTRCVWSSNSTSSIARFPAQGQRAVWDTAEAAVGPVDNHAWWPGIRDPSYTIWSNAAVKATQDPGYPRTQASGPYYVGDIADTSVSQTCRFLVMEYPQEIGVWQYGAALGIVVCHFNNHWPTSSGRVPPYQIFLGAFPYAADSSSSYANEPSASAMAEVATRAAALVWPT